jgi:tRNA-2-methylthio-N6-dimethylallyladenosine synthase
VREIIEECTRWVDAGAREILLLGQTVDSYRDASLPPPASDDPDETQFPFLLRAIARDVPKLARLRYTSPHPRHATPSLVAAHAELDVLARHVHLPVQSGSDRVLKRMIRRYTRAEYVARARALLAARPDMTMSTDIIVGFPGETDDDFEATLSLVREVGFTALFGFKYSPRPYTPALKLKDDVSEQKKSERLGRLFEVVEAQGRAHLARLVGTKLPVLIEGPSKNGGMFSGRSDRNEIVHIAAPEGRDVTGAIVTCEILSANKHSLVGAIDPDAVGALPLATRPARRPLPLVAGAH